MKKATRSAIALMGVLLLAGSVRADGWNLFDRRLGMFIHWGIYSVGEWHCQQHWRKRMSRADYEKFVGQFTAGKFSADAFVDVAESAGAEYIVFTSKHHDGFCMWDTATTDYKVTNTPAKRDIIAELAAACHRRGMKLGFYYSNPDWHHPNSHNEKSSHQIPMESGDVPDMEKYIAYVKAQVTELLTRYGEIVCFFWDIPTHLDRPEMDALVRRLQPGIKINDRGWGNKATCDYSTPERDYKWDVSCGRNTVAGVVGNKQIVVTRKGDTLFLHFPKGMDATGLDMAPFGVQPEKATLLNTGAPLKARLELMPWSALRTGHETLHVWGIPADDLANECVVLRLDFAPGALK